MIPFFVENMYHSLNSVSSDVGSVSYTPLLYPARDKHTTLWWVRVTLHRLSKCLTSCEVQRSVRLRNLLIKSKL